LVSVWFWFWISFRFRFRFRIWLDLELVLVLVWFQFRFWFCLVSKSVCLFPSLLRPIRRYLGSSFRIFSIAILLVQLSNFNPILRDLFSNMNCNIFIPSILVWIHVLFWNLKYCTDC
jgi:hypothetical protein